MDGTTLIVRELGDGIWVFNEGNDGREYVDAYLITGKERALVVDSLMNDTTFYEKARQITNLPIDVVVTHGHPDHAGLALKAFYDSRCDIYMREMDLPMLKKGVEAAWFKPLPPDKVFDLGGRKLEVIPLPGHTSGSVVLFDRAAQILYTGDAIGAGVFWMQIPNALPLNEFMKNLESLRKDMEDYSDLKIHPGHRHQAPVQLTREFMDDTLLMTRKIVSGEWVGEDSEMTMGGQSIKFKKLAYKLMTDYCYNPENL